MDEYERLKAMKNSIVQAEHDRITAPFQTKIAKYEADLTALRARLDENMTAVADYAIWLEKAERERDEAKHQTHLQCQQALVYKDSAEAANRTLSSMRVSEDAWLLERDQLHANLSEYMAKCGDLSGDVAVLTSDNAVLREALNLITDFGGITAHGNGSWCAEKAHAALLKPDLPP